jgi:hypothetical protein
METEKIATIKEVQNILPYVSKSNAALKIQLCRDAIGKAKPKILTMKDFCLYFGIL